MRWYNNVENFAVSPAAVDMYVQITIRICPGRYTVYKASSVVNPAVLTIFYTVYNIYSINRLLLCFQKTHTNWSSC